MPISINFPKDFPFSPRTNFSSAGVATNNNGAGANENARQDALLACEIVRKIFQHIKMCIENDRSQVKLRAIEKGIIKGMINDGVLAGINDYVMKMNPHEMMMLMDDIEIEVRKRKHA